jgi:hypothetical protein
MEERAVNLDLYQIYADPFILFGYVTSIPFFIALYNGYKILDYIAQKETFSFKAIRALKNIKFCAILFSIFIVSAGVYIVLFHDKKDDPAGFIALCILSTLMSYVVAFAASIFEKKLQKR